MIPANEVIKYYLLGHIDKGKKMKKQLKSLLFLFTVLFTLPTVSYASFVWEFTNSGLTYSPNETIFLEATITNTGTSNLTLGLPAGAGISYGTFPSIYSNPSLYYSFDFLYHSLFYLELLPGETVDFTFGKFTPSGNMAEGTYTTSWAYMMFNDGLNITEVNGGKFTATVVPLPAALWLFITGMIGLFGFRASPKTQK